MGYMSISNLTADFRAKPFREKSGLKIFVAELLMSILSEVEETKDSFKTFLLRDTNVF